MENYSLLELNRNITQNNIEKIKRSMKRLKETINRSNSNNYKNMKIIRKTNDHLNLMKANSNDIGNSLYYNSSKETISRKDEMIQSPYKNEYINFKNKRIGKYKNNYNLNTKNNTEFNINKKLIDRSFYEQNISNYNLTHNYESNNIYSPIIPSRNKFKNDLDNKTDIQINNNLENNIADEPKLTDFSPYIYRDDESLILNNFNDNNYFDKNKNKFIRNKSAKQINIIHNLINNNNFKEYSNYSNVLNTNENSFSNSNIFANNKNNNIITNKINNNNQKEYENYLKNQISMLDNINKGLETRYKKIFNNYTLTNEQNNLLVDKINEIERKTKNIKNINLNLENEYNAIKDKLLKKNNEENSFNNKDKMSLRQQNEELKNKIEEYDEIILQLKNQINLLVEESENEKENNSKENDEIINDDNIINELENKIEDSYKEINEQEKAIILIKNTYNQLLFDIDQKHIDKDNNFKSKEKESLFGLNNINNKYLNYINNDISRSNKRFNIYENDNDKHNYSEILQPINSYYNNNRDKIINRSYDIIK
jgi:hypothetical protein